MRPIILPALVAGALLGTWVGPAAGQTLAQRIMSAPDGDVRMSFASLPDVCGDGERNIQTGRRHHTITNDDDDGDSDRDCPCEPGPVRVSLTLHNHLVTRVRTRVGGTWRTVPRNSTDLGTVSTREAVTALLAIAAEARHAGGHEAVFPATLADSVTVWPQLLRLARDTNIPRETRRQAVFWVSQAAGDSATAGLSELAESDSQDREIRTQAVFGLSQRPREEGVPALIRIARTNRDPEVRRSALFWLGQSDDPRALALFEELLVRR
jgi:hypothetical protein